MISRPDTQTLRAAVIGARGHVGYELLRLLDRHPDVQIILASSRAHAGQAVHEQVDGFSDPHLMYGDTDLDALEDLDADVLFLALPDGLAGQRGAQWQRMAERMVIIDLGSDFRFDRQWCYGLTEHAARPLCHARRIANPGCYATAMQFALWPFRDAWQGEPVVFGVSGYSGAGTTASRRNDLEVLRDNLLAYRPSGHMHEREVSHQLSRPIRFMPHVGAFFRGIHLTISLTLEQPCSQAEVLEQLKRRYHELPWVQVQAEPPEIRQVAGTHRLVIGGIDIADRDPTHLTLCVCLDNLLKGAATQAIQNMNLACLVSEADRAQANLETLHQLSRRGLS